MNKSKFNFENKIGEVYILNKAVPIPPDYRLLTVDECHWIQK